MKKFNVGDKVVAKMQHGYAPVHGMVVDAYTNQYGVDVAVVEYGKHAKERIVRAFGSLELDK